MSNEAQPDPPTDPPASSDPNLDPDSDSDSDSDTGLTGQELAEFDTQLKQLEGTQWEPQRGPASKAVAWLILIVMLALFLGGVAFLVARFAGLLP